MIPVETVVGITQGWRFTQQHPVLTGVVTAALVCLALFAASRSVRQPERKVFWRAASLLVVIGAAVFFSWAYNARSPGLTTKVLQVTGPDSR
jgi:bacteriorhodopsin